MHEIAKPMTIHVHIPHVCVHLLQFAALERQQTAGLEIERCPEEPIWLCRRRCTKTKRPL